MLLIMLRGIVDHRWRGTMWWRLLRWRGVARRGAAAAVVPSVAWRRVAAFVAMARRCVAAVVVPSVAWCHVAASVAMARRCAAPACALSVAAAALVRVATVAVKNRYGNVAAVRPAGAVACSAR